jgi:hypothetical protein
MPDEELARNPSGQIRLLKNDAGLFPFRTSESGFRQSDCDQKSMLAAIHQQNNAALACTF